MSFLSSNIFYVVKNAKNLILKYPVFVKTSKIQKNLKKRRKYFMHTAKSLKAEKLIFYFHTTKKTSKKKMFYHAFWL